MIGFALTFIIGSFGVDISTQNICRQRLMLAQLMIEIQIESRSKIPTLAGSVNRIRRLSRFRKPHLIRCIRLIAEIRGKRCLEYI
ncbi:Uncharacterised protein [Segatella copri]|nr:Uncharacterised protein [Segatella copri]